MSFLSILEKSTEIHAFHAIIKNKEPGKRELH